MYRLHFFFALIRSPTHAKKKNNSILRNLKESESVVVLE